MRPLSLLAGLLILVATTSTAHASIMFSYLATDTGGNNINGKDFTVGPGGSVTVNFYLVEALSALNNQGTAQQSLIALEGGVKSLAVRVARLGTGPADATVAFAANPVFGTTSITNITGVGAKSGNIQDALAKGQLPVTSSSKGSSTDGVYTKMFIGTATITAVSLGKNTFNLQTIASAGSAMRTGAKGFGLEFTQAAGTKDAGATGLVPEGYDYTGVRSTGVNLNSPVEFSVTAVPEPTTMTLGVLGLVGMGVSAYRRRRMAQTIAA